MARRRRGRKGRGRRSKTIPVLPTMVALYPAFEAYQNAGLTSKLPVSLVGAYTGYNLESKAFVSAVPIRNVALLVGATFGHKIANRVGINRYIKKATMGFLSL